MTDKSDDTPLAIDEVVVHVDAIVEVVQFDGVFIPQAIDLTDWVIPWSDWFPVGILPSLWVLPLIGAVLPLEL